MKLSKIISAVLHPIFLPTWMMVIMVLSGITRFSPGNDGVFIVSTFIVTCVFPGIVIVMMKRWGMIGSLEMEDRNDRVGPIFLMVISLYATIRLFRDIPILAMYSFYLGAVLVISVLAFVITFFWKISLHTLGWGGFTGCLYVMSLLSMKAFFPYLIASILFSGIVGSVRLKEKSHDKAQIFSGFAVGFAVVLLLYYIMFL